MSDTAGAAPGADELRAIGTQQLHREMARATGLLTPYPDDGDALSKALWQVRYSLAKCASCEPTPDLGRAREFLLIETILLAAQEEQLALRPLVAALARYGASLAAVRAEQARLRSIDYKGRTADAPTFDVLLAERWAAQDELDALALALAGGEGVGR